MSMSKTRLLHELLTHWSLATKPLQSCPTLCDPIDPIEPPGSPVPGILQARTLEWVAIVFSNAWKWKVEVKLFSGVWLFATPWTAVHQAPRSMGFNWSGLPLRTYKVICPCTSPTSNCPQPIPSWSYTGWSWPHNEACHNQCSIIT